MPSADLLTALEKLRGETGAAAARARRELLDALATVPWPAAAGARSRLRATLEHLCAYPDDAGIARRASALAARLPARKLVHEFSYAGVRRLLRLDPRSCEIDWRSFDEQDETFGAVLDLLVLPGESDGLGDARLRWRERCARLRRDGDGDLVTFLGLLERSGLPERVREQLYESCHLPVRYLGPAPGALRLPAGRLACRRRPADRRAFPLVPFVRRPLAGVRRAGAAEIAIATRALAARALEIYPLMHASPDALELADAGGGLRVLLAGVVPERRATLEGLFFFLLARNGVPLGYGPAGVFGGCCELGVNLFPEFRGGEVRLIYGRLMRVLHHRLAVDHFFMTRYGMGEGNEEAIRSGAFWFYRKLGFRPDDAGVEALARAEEARKAADPSYRCSRATLRRLARSEVALDLSGGRHRPLDLAALAGAESRLLAAAAGAEDRARLASRHARRAARLLGLDARGRALRALAPALALIPDLAHWPARERAALARFVAAKDARSEARAARLSARLPARLAAALAAAATTP